MNLKDLVHREINEGMTEKELASAVEVSVQPIANILADNLPQDPAIWETFARHFRVHAESLRLGDPPHLPHKAVPLVCFVPNANGISVRDTPGSDAVIGPVDVDMIVQAEDPSTYSFLHSTTRDGQAGWGSEPTSDGFPVSSSDVMERRHRIVGAAL